jgi:hypothetical protein
MLNLKKGLALVLAAATAFTFAPVSTLSANAAATWDDDGLTATTGKIDSIKTLDSFKLTTSAPDSTKTLQLAEHQDKVNGVQVKAFRITINRVVDKNNDNAYHDLVDLDNPAYAVKSSITNSKLNNDSITGSAFSEDTSWGGVSNLKKEKSYIVNYTDGVAGGTTTNPKDVWQIGGSLVTFKSAYSSDNALIGDTNARSTTVKVEALDSADSSKATVLDSQTFTVNIAVNSVDLSIQAPSDKNQAEGTEIEVPWKLENNNSNGNVEGIYVSADPAQLISAANNSSSNLQRLGTITSAGTNAGTIKFKTGMQGSVTVTINGYGTKADGSKGVVVSKSFDLNITPGNGKLRVSYNTDSTLAKYKGQKYTFTDDAETIGLTTQGIENWDSTTNTVDSNGNYKISAKAVYGADKASLATSEGSSNYIHKDATGTSLGSGDKAKNVSEITDTAGQKWVSYYLDETGFLPAAEPVVENGQKTLQITASSDSNAKISYTLVAPATLHDAVVKTTEGKKDATHYTYESKDYYYNPVTGGFSGALDSYDVAYGTGNATTGYTTQAVKHDSDVQAGDYKLYSAAEGKKYGAVDSNGLVTLKNANFDVPLYVVITAKASDKTATNAARKTSTFIVPIKTAQLSPLSFYAASEFGAEVDETGIIDSKSYNADGKIVLTGDHTSDKLTIDTNAGSAYVTGDVDNKDGKFSYDEATNTVSVDTTKAKDGDTCKLVIKTSSAPDIAGTVTATFNVEYHKDWKSTNTLELSDATVSKTSPRDRVVAKAGEASSVVVFDTNNFYKKANNTRGYEKLKTTDAGYGDVILTSTGWVTYYKNDGDLYVRAYAKKDGFANTKWVYAKVTYGQNATPNDLAVTEDRVVIKAGEKAEVHATASTAISFTVDDTAVATVASAGAIQVTGVKPGQTTLNVTAAADTKKGIAEKTIKVPVVVTDANGEIPSNDNVKKPAKVTGVKITNLKGGKVKVTWTKQSQKNIKYYVKKTVGKKSAGKSVGSNKATLSVKKGATVKVKVKAYIYDATGKKLVGSYSKTVTKKTDKK